MSQGKTLLNSESFVTFSGKSMYPSLLEGDQISVEYFQSPMPIHELEPGQVVLTNIDKQWVVHRIVGFDSSSYLKGDWSLLQDEARTAWGRVVKINNQPSELLLNNKRISTLSQMIGVHNFWLQRKILKLLLFTYVKLIRIRLWFAN